MVFCLFCPCWGVGQWCCCTGIKNSLSKLVEDLLPNMMFLRYAKVLRNIIVMRFTVSLCYALESVECLLRVSRPCVFVAASFHPCREKKGEDGLLVMVTFLSLRIPARFCLSVHQAITTVRVCKTIFQFPLLCTVRSSDVHLRGSFFQWQARSCPASQSAEGLVKPSLAAGHNLWGHAKVWYSVG